MIQTHASPVETAISGINTFFLFLSKYGSFIAERGKIEQFGLHCI